MRKGRWQGAAVTVGSLMILVAFLSPLLTAQPCEACPSPVPIWGLPFALLGLAVAWFGAVSLFSSRRMGLVTVSAVLGLALFVFLAPVVHDYPGGGRGCPRSLACKEAWQSPTLEYSQAGGIYLPGGEYCIAAFRSGTTPDGGSWSSFGCVAGGA